MRRASSTASMSEKPDNSSMPGSTVGAVVTRVIALEDDSMTHQTSPNAAGKELNWRKLGKGYALRTMLAIQAGKASSRWTSFAIIITCCLFGAAVVTRWRPWEPSARSTHHYSVYIDGGSSGTRIHVFRYSLAPWPAYANLVLPEPSHSVEPGLSHFANTPFEAAQSLLDLLDFAYSKVPQPLWPTTPVRLLATGGLRLLTNQQQAAILEQCATVLSASQFLFRKEWAKVIGGDMEGLYAWAGVNYASGLLQERSGHHSHSGSRKALDQDSQGAGNASFRGVLELGGASFQVTFLPDGQDALDTRRLPLKLPGVKSRLFTHSYLGLGMDSAHAAAVDLMKHKVQEQQQQQEADNDAEHAPLSVVHDPCLPIGYTSEDGRIGSSSFVECLTLARQVLPLSACPQASEAGWQQSEAFATGLTGMDSQRNILSSSAGTRRGKGSRQRCVLDGVDVPVLSGSFLAVENLFWTAKAIGLTPDGSLQELQDAGQRHCSQHWSSLQAKFSGHIPDHFITRYCFGAAYIFVLLHLGLGISLEERRVTFTNTLQRQEGEEEVPLNWVTGAAVVDAMNQERQVAAAQQLPSAQWHPAVLVGVILAVVGMVALAVAAVAILAERWLRGWWQAPQVGPTLWSSSSEPTMGPRPAGSSSSSNTWSLQSSEAAPGGALARTPKPSRLGLAGAPASGASPNLMIRPTSLGSIDVRE